MKRCALLVAVLLFFLPLETWSIRALELGDVLTGYTLASWREGEGQSLGRVSAIAQDTDGYLWLGTDVGLARFDGLRMELLGGGDTRLPTAPVRSLLLDRRGQLWAGYADGAGLYVLPTGSDASVDPVHVGTVTGTVTALAEDAAGVVWVGHSGGLARVSHDELSDSGITDVPVQSVVADERGTIWVGTTTGLLKRSNTDRFETVADIKGPVRDLSVDDSGVVWTTHETRGFRRLGSAGDDRSRPSGIGSSVLHDSHGNLWVATIGQGLWRIHPGPADVFERATVLTGLLSDGVFSIFEDREGNIWVGTQEGLNRLTPHRATPVTGLGVVRSVAVTSDGAAWAAGVEGLIQLRGVTSQSPGQRRVWPLADVGTLRADSTGTLWVATPSGLHRMLRGTLTPLHEQPVLRQVTAMTSDRAGRIWVADARHGIQIASGRHLTNVPLSETQGMSIRVMLVDRRDRLWLASATGQVAVGQETGLVHVFGPDDGPPHTSVNALIEDASNRIWVGGDQGLSRLVDNTFKTIDASHGLPRSDVAAIGEDTDGFLWLGIRGVGIIRLHPREFDRALSDPTYRVRYAHYGTTGGIAGVPLSRDSQNVARAPDGRLWFVTGRGLTVVEPQSVDADWVPPPTAVRIQMAVADEERFAATSGLALPATTSRLRIEYTALSLTFPDRVRFRYRLEGFDPDWVEVGTRRQAVFTNLAPGRYRFRVQARTDDGTWSESSQAWGFSIRPALYQTLEFQVAIVGLLVALVGVTWRIRLRKVHREVALVFAERTRLSREIHDTLLQSLVGLALQIDVVAQRVGPRSAEHDQLTRIRRLVEEYIRDARQSIWDLRSTDLQALDLVPALRRLGHRVTQDAGVRFDLTVVGTPRACPPKVQAHVLRIAQEAMANAIRHGHAHGVQLELAFLDHSLRLNVVDDGCGFDPAYLVNLPDGHFGLAGMRERAEDVGGRFSVSTSRGAGTTIETIIPLPSQA